MSWFVGAVINAVLNWLAKYLGIQILDAKHRADVLKESERVAADNSAKLNNAGTEKEREDATTDIARNSF